MIWLIGGVIAAVAAFAVAFPWLSQLPKAIITNRRANIVAYQTRLRELEAEAAAGVLAPETLERSRQELTARAAREAEASAAPGAAMDAGPASWKIPAALALLLIAFGATWYGVAGSWRVQALVDLAQIDAEAARKVALEQQVKELQQRVGKQPDDVDSWTWLGRSLQRLERYPEAAQAFARASELKGGQDVDLQIEQASVLAHSDPVAAATQFEQVLRVAPNETRALWYAGALAMQRGDGKAALDYWNRLLKLDIPPQARAQIQHAVAALSKQLGVPAQPAESAAASGPRLNLEISLAPELKARLKPGDTLLVFAQEPGGPPMPLAAQKIPIDDFPVAVSLDDSNSVMPTRKLSSVTRWHVVARVSGSGQAQAQSGDLQGERDVSQKDARRTVKLRIDHALP